MVRLFSILLLLSICIVGCSTVYDVSNNSKSLDGIPFYIVKGAIKQETTYLEQYFNLKLTITMKYKESTNFEVYEKDVPFYDYKNVRDFINYLDVNKDVGKQQSKILSYISEVKSKFDALETYDLTENTDESNIQLISNELIPTTYVDYDNPLYINSTYPWIGSTDLAVELNPNGTISKTSGSIDSKAPELLTSTLSAFPTIYPLKEIILNNEEKVTAVEGIPVLQEATISLNVNPNKIKHVISMLYRDTLEYKIEVIPFEMHSNKGYSYKRVNLNQKSESENESKENAINIKGEIILPEEKGK